MAEKDAEIAWTVKQATGQRIPLSYLMKYFLTWESGIAMKIALLWLTRLICIGLCSRKEDVLSSQNTRIFF